MAKSLAVYLGIILSSGAEGEILMAARQARQLLEAEGASANDVAEAAQNYKLIAKLPVIIAKAREVKAERDELACRVAELERRPTAAIDLPDTWRGTAIVPSVDRKHIDWLNTLDLQGRIRLTDWETRFLADLARRRSALTTKQTDSLRRIVQDAVARTGLAPP